MEHKKSKDPTYNPPIHNFPLYGLVFCGLIIISIGIIMQLNNIAVKGVAVNSYRENYAINGPAAIVFGLAILSFPVYIFIKQYRERKRFDRNIF